MFRNKEERLRSTQKKLTTAANTIQKEILNDRDARSQFTQTEVEAFRQAVQALREFKSKVEHAKERHIREKKEAERVEANVKAENERRVKKVVNSIPINSLFELSLTNHFRGQELLEESEVSLWERNTLKSAASNPTDIESLFISAKEHVASVLMEMLPNQEHRSGYDEVLEEWVHYYHKPESCTHDFIVELVKKQIRDVPIRKPDNVEYVNEAVRLINLARSVNQAINDIKQTHS